MALIDPYLSEVVQKGASDLHINAARKPIIRLQGMLVSLTSETFSEETLLGMFHEIMPPYARSVFEKNKDTDFAYSHDSIHRFRVNVFKDKGGVGAVFRHIPNTLPTFESIRLEQGGKNLCALSKGLVLITGPTGSGKSTTLAAMINHINATRALHIVTIEDPIEFVYVPNKCLIHQRELHTHTQSFTDALRAVLRQDPDVILVGEMRDVETTKLAIEAAETGHLVFATLHTNTAYSTITRIINQFGEEEQELIRSMLADNLKGVICQTLLQREDGKSGRVAAREIMLYSVAGANLIRENKLHQIQSILDSNIELGMVSLNISLANFVSQNLITAEQALAHSMDQKDLAGRLKH
jgi:twitching motility protein PilT